MADNWNKLEANEVIRRRSRDGKWYTLSADIDLGPQSTQEFVSHDGEVL